MKHLVGVILILAPVLSMAASEDPAGPATPAEKYRALLGEYNRTGGAYRKATTDRQRRAAVESLDKFAQKFLDLADENPRDPIALPALRQAIQAVVSTDSLAQQAWETNQTDFPLGSKDPSAARAVTILLRDHLESGELAPVCDRMRYSVRTEYTNFLRAALRTNPHRKVQAAACLALAQFLNERLHMRGLLKDRPELTRRYEVLFGKDYVEELQQPSRAVLAREVEALFDRATAYDDVKTASGDTVAERARSGLYDIRHLDVGKMAPDIEGKDQDGAPFRLSDYRGKVVLLYFWTEY